MYYISLRFHSIAFNSANLVYGISEISLVRYEIYVSDEMNEIH